MRPPHPRSTRRPGGVSIAALILIPILALCLVIAVFAAEAYRAKSALQTVADGAALAAAAEAVDDSTLTADKKWLAAAVEVAREKAALVAKENAVLAGPTFLNFEDVEFGTRGAKGFSALAVDGENGDPLALAKIDTVRVSAYRTAERGNPLRLMRGVMLSRMATDATSGATAVIDRDVIGVRPLPEMAAPLMPIGLKSDPSAKAEESWEHQVDKAGRDDWRFDRDLKNGRLVPKNDARGSDGLHGDGLREMVVVLNGEQANGVLLQFGVTELEDVAKQVLDGVRNKDLAAFNGEVVLGEGGEIAVPGTTGGSSPLEQVVKALLVARARGDALVWPLYQRTDGHGYPVLSGFVAARIAWAGYDDLGRPVLVLQPARRALASCVTARSRKRDAVADNKYLARVRLAD